MITDTLDAIRVVTDSLCHTRDLALLAALMAPAVYFRWAEIANANDSLKVLLAALVTQYMAEPLVPPDPPPAVPNV